MYKKDVDNLFPYLHLKVTQYICLIPIMNYIVKFHFMLSPKISPASFFKYLYNRCTFSPLTPIFLTLSSLLRNFLNITES